MLLGSARTIAEPWDEGDGFRVLVGQSGRRPGGRASLKEVPPRRHAACVGDPPARSTTTAGGRLGDRHMPGGQRPLGPANGGVTEGGRMSGGCPSWIWEDLVNLARCFIQLWSFGANYVGTPHSRLYIRLSRSTTCLTLHTLLAFHAHSSGAGACTATGFGVNVAPGFVTDSSLFQELRPVPPPASESFAWTSPEPPALTSVGSNGNYQSDGGRPVAPPPRQIGPRAQVMGLMGHFSRDGSLTYKGTCIGLV